MRNIPDNIIDLADVVIFDNAPSIINDLIRKGYVFIDSKDELRNALLIKNREALRITAAVTDVSDIPSDMAAIKEAIKDFNEEEIYNCRDSRLYPLITLTQLSRPGVKWTFSGNSWIDYGNYVANKLYYRGGSPKLAVFIDVLKNTEKLYIVRNNSFVEFSNTFTGENEIARVPYVEDKWTWKEIFYRATLIPAEFGKVKLVDRIHWKDAVETILRDCTRHTVKLISLNQYMRGVAE
jgi:hypothetical protein